MAISNTRIQIKRSSVTTLPSGLNAGELAYSFASNTLFLGNAAGTGVVNIGGLLYTQTIDNASSANGSGTLVKRDASGNASFNYITANIIGGISGTANAATYLQNPQNFSISGGDITASAVSFNGSSAVILNASLNTLANVSPGQYGNTTTIPVITVAANGRVTNVSTSTISTSFTVSGNTGSGTQAGGGTLTVQGGGSGITTSVTGSGGSETVTIATDSTVARTNTSIGTQTFNSDINLPSNSLTVGGTITATNLAISGNITYANSISTLNVTDPIIYLAANNNGNLVDIGVVGHFIGAGHTGDTSHYQHTGFVRDYNDNKWKLFSNVSTEPTTTVNFGEANTVYDVIKVGGVDVSSGNITSANVITANTLVLTNALGIAYGGTGATTFTTGQITYYNGTQLTSLANTGSAGTYANAAYVPVITTDGYGRVSLITNTAIAIDASQITSGTLGYTRGGTGSTSYTTGNILVAGASGFQSIANVTPTVTGALASSNTITSITFDAYGRVTAYTGASISGLTVSQGGTGLSSFTTNGITYGNGTGALGVTAAAGTSDQSYSNQILTVTNSGVPVWSTTMDGGTF
jgi:hypothetical protein